MPEEPQSAGRAKGLSGIGFEMASAVGALAVLSARRAGSAVPLNGMLAAMALRFATILILGLSLGLSGWFATRPLLIWIALGYVAQLALDARYATRGF